MGDNPFGVKNPEHDLVNELVACATHQKLPSAVYKRGLFGDMAQHMENASSINQFLIAYAVAYSSGTQEEQKQARVVLLTQPEGAFFSISRKEFMGDEELSTIYGPWGHVSPVAVILAAAQDRGDKEMVRAAMEWGGYWFGLMENCVSPGGIIMTVGARSGGHSQTQPDLPVPEAVWVNWLYAIATGGDEARWEAAARRLNLGFGKDPIHALGEALRGQLKMMASAPMPSYGLLTPLHVVSDADGHALAVWIERSVNPNTPSLMAALWRDGAPIYLPQLGGAHDRSGADEATCTRVGGSLVYTSSIGGQERQEAAIPEGGSELVYGGPPASPEAPGGTEPPLAEPPAPPPAAPAPGRSRGGCLGALVLVPLGAILGLSGGLASRVVTLIAPMAAPRSRMGGLA